MHIYLLVYLFTLQRPVAVTSTAELNGDSEHEFHTAWEKQPSSLFQVATVSAYA
jgi:hypothetical protein